MFKFDVSEEIKSREIAKKYFPHYFYDLTGHAFNCYGYDYSKFQAKYREYLEAYFNDEFDKEKRDFIKIGYDYLNSRYSRNNVMSNREKTVAVFNRLWTQYLQLEDQIATYKFDPKRDNSKGAIQNRINNQILDQLSLFNPLIYNICFTTSKKIRNKELSQEFIEQLNGKLDNLFNELNDMQNKLLYAEDGYHEDWNHCARPESFYERVSVKDLGKSARDWRKTRNEACYIMLKFVFEMVDIDIATYYGTFDYRNEQYGLDEFTVQKIDYFNQCLAYLQHSNNYFCYLDKEDKQEIAIQKVLRKK